MHQWKNKVVQIALCCLAMSHLPASTQEYIYYRYIDDKGLRVISSQIPAKYVAKGYDVIAQDGKLIKRVPPEPSPEEKARIEKEIAEKERLEKWDSDLLRRYSHPDDIEAAKKRKLSQNSNIIGIIQRNIEKIDIEINRYQGFAASDEREGRDPSPDTLQRIELLKRERQAEVNDLRDRQSERERIEESYNEDIARFKVIRPETAKD